MDRVVVILFAYRRINQTKVQIENLIRLGYTNLYVFQDFCPEIEPFNFSHKYVTVITRNYNYGQFLNYHNAFIQLHYSYDVAIVLEDDIVLEKKYTPPENMKFSHINIGPSATFCSKGEISTWGYCINLKFYVSTMGCISLGSFLRSLFRSGRIYRRNFVVQYFNSIQKRVTWGLVWQLTIDNVAGVVLESDQIYCNIVDHYFFDGENVNKRINPSRVKVLLKNLTLLPSVIAWIFYKKRINNLI